jgi:hypothetical protein
MDKLHRVAFDGVEIEYQTHGAGEHVVLVHHGAGILFARTPGVASVVGLDPARPAEFISPSSLFSASRAIRGFASGSSCFWNGCHVSSHSPSPMLVIYSMLNNRPSSRTVCRLSSRAIHPV